MHKFERRFFNSLRTVNEAAVEEREAFEAELDEIYSSILKLLENKSYIEFGKHAKENSIKFLWSNIIEKYKKENPYEIGDASKNRTKKNR